MKTSLVLVGFAAVLFSCSSPQLKRFDDKELDQGVSEELAKKFEVQDVQKEPTAPSEPSKTDASKKTSKKPEPVKGKPVVKSGNEPPVRRKDAMPFEVGEKLRYSIRALGLTAGHFDMEVLPTKMINGREVYPLTGVAKTVKFFEIIYRVHDRVESFFDFNGLYSHKYTMNLDESKQSRQVLELYDYERKKSFYSSKLDHVEKGYSEKREEFDIPLWSQDPVSMLYFLRTVDLPSPGGPVVKYPVVVDGKPWEVQLRFDRREKKNYLGKDLDTVVLRMDNYEGGQLKNKDHQIWIAEHPRRFILRIEAKIRVGAIAAALESAVPSI